MHGYRRRDSARTKGEDAKLDYIIAFRDSNPDFMGSVERLIKVYDRFVQPAKWPVFKTLTQRCQVAWDFVKSNPEAKALFDQAPHSKKL